MMHSMVWLTAMEYGMSLIPFELARCEDFLFEVVGPIMLERFPKLQVNLKLYPQSPGNI